MFAKNIKTLRKSRHLTQTELAKQINCDITQTTFAGYEHGCCLPHQKRIKTLADFFGISANELICGKLSKKEKTKLANDIISIVKDHLTENLSNGDVASINDADSDMLSKQFIEVLEREQFIK